MARPARDQHLLRGEALAAARGLGADRRGPARPRLVQHSLDLVDGRAGAGRRAAAVGGSWRRRADHGLTRPLDLHRASPRTRGTCCSTPTPRRARAAEAWFGRAIELTRRSAAWRPADTSARSASPTGRTRRVGGRAGRSCRTALGRLAGDARRAGLEYLVVENLAAAREPSTMAMIRDLLTDGDADHVPDPPLPGRRPHVRARDERRRPRPVRLAARARAGRADRPAPAVGRRRRPPLAVHAGQRTPIGRIDADRVIDALGEGGASRTALILEVIPAFEQDDDEVLDDLERRSTTGARRWPRAVSATLTARARAASGGPPRASRTSGPARRPGRGLASRSTSGRPRSRRGARPTWASTGYGRLGDRRLAPQLGDVAAGSARRCGRSPSRRRGPSGAGRGRSAPGVPSAAGPATGWPTAASG